MNFTIRDVQISWDVPLLAMAGPCVIESRTLCLNPAFLYRQTDLLCACAQTSQPINTKIDQLIAPNKRKKAVDNLQGRTNRKTTLAEPGTFFRYNRIVNDMTAIKAMKRLGCPVIFDTMYDTQVPGGPGQAGTGRRQTALILSGAAMAGGAYGLFVKVHPEPEKVSPTPPVL